MVFILLCGKPLPYVAIFDVLFTRPSQLWGSKKEICWGRKQLWKPWCIPPSHNMGSPGLSVSRKLCPRESRALGSKLIFNLEKTSASPSDRMWSSYWELKMPSKQEENDGEVFRGRRVRRIKGVLFLTVGLLFIWRIGWVWPIYNKPERKDRNDNWILFWDINIVLFLS